MMRRTIHKPVCRFWAEMMTAAVLLCAILCMMSCGNAGDVTGNPAEDTEPLTSFALDGTVPDQEMDLSYAQGFRIFYYPDGARLLHLERGGDYLLPGEETGRTLPSETVSGHEITVLPARPSELYLAASSVMALMRSIGAMDQIRYTGIEEDHWTLEEPVEAMRSGRLLFAGKYSAPDYELLRKGHCDLAIESSMIWHAPEVKEQLERLGIPVFIDYSSYEGDPRGRLEWVRLYGELTGTQAQAEAFFTRQLEYINAVLALSGTDRTAAVFAIDSAGRVVVRRSSDYIPRLIAMAGGTYVPENLAGDPESGSGSVILTMEQFYEDCRDADILIYNATYTAAPQSVAELVRQQPMLAQFRAVQNGQVFAADGSFYQATDSTAGIVRDLHAIFNGDAGEPEWFHALPSEKEAG